MCSGPPPFGARPDGAGPGAGPWAFRGGEGPGGRARFPSPSSRPARLRGFLLPHPPACAPPAPLRASLLRAGEVTGCQYLKLSASTADSRALPRRSWVYVLMCGLGLVTLPLRAAGLILNRVMLSCRVC